MRTSILVATSAGAAAVLTHGLVISAVSFNEPLPISTYRGFFWHVVSAVERLWSYAHAWQSGSHVRDFGWFFAPTVQLICPLIGFALFWAISRYKVDANIWKPLAIVVLLAIPNRYINLVPGHSLPWVEAVRTIFIVWLMVWSTGALRISRPDTAITQSLAVA